MQRKSACNAQYTPKQSSYSWIYIEDGRGGGGTY